MWTKFWAGLALAERTLMVCLMLALPCLYGLNVILYNLAPGLARHFDGIEELSRFLLVWLVCVSLGYTMDKGRHVSMNLLQRFIGPALLLWIQRVLDLVGALFCAYVAVLGWRFLQRIIDTGQVSNMLDVSMGWLYAALPLGMALLTLRYLRYVLFPAQRPVADDQPD